MEFYGIWSTGKGKWERIGQDAVCGLFSNYKEVVLGLFWCWMHDFQDRIDDERKAGRYTYWQDTWQEAGYQVRMLGDDGLPVGDPYN